MKADVQERIQKLQLTEESLHNYINQKQQIQAQLMELESATNALQGTKHAYQIIGSVMVEKESVTIKKELGERMESVKSRVDALEKQEKKLKQQAEKLQKEIMEKMK